LELLETADLRGELPTLTVPSLWIAGRRDRLVDPRAMREAADAAPGASFAVIEHGGHAPFLTHADDVAARLDAFVQELPACARPAAVRCSTPARCAARVRAHPPATPRRRRCSTRSKGACSNRSTTSRTANPAPCSTSAAPPVTPPRQCAGAGRVRASSPWTWRCRCCARRGRAQAGTRCRN